MTGLLLICALVSQPAPAWDFTTPDAALTWTPNAHFTDVAIHDGALEAKGAGADPIFNIDDVDFVATANRYLILEIAADRPGRGEVFFTGTHEGPYGGFSQDKSVPFHVAAGDGLQRIPIFPFWQAEGRIVRLRLDLYDGARFRIAGLRVAEIPVAPAGNTAWDFTGDTPSDWTRFGADHRTLWGMLAGVDAETHGWLAVRLDAQREAAVEVRWAARAARGYEAVHAPVLPGEPRWYNVELIGEPTWAGDIAAIGLHLPSDVTLLGAQLADGPVGPAEFVVEYFGPENGVNRAGREVPLLGRFANTGGEAARVPLPTLRLPEGVTLVADPEGPAPRLKPGERADVRWTVRADEPGAYTLALGEGDDAEEATLNILPAVTVEAADYVPAPWPVATEVDVAAYYFPGWGRDASWEPVRSTAPNRKPVLGYYDESKVEVVDWQIKWAVENGISCFLVDWYWVAGRQQLTHWFEAYREARYRDALEVAIMWANHNPPGTHSLDDWRAVTQEWIDHYFNLPTYYRIDGMPAIFFWSPTNLRNDLGGSEAVKEALALSQQMARDAGYEGIAFVALFDHDTPQQAARLAEEGYHGATNYHEWGDATYAGDTPNRYRFADVVETSPEAWARREADSGALEYYPVADTGWDSRPWHGTRARVFEGRTPELWETLLRDLKTFAAEEDKPLVVLGPLNEWGEGSYIEPAVEYDFAMYEAIRRVFAKGDPEDWPLNLAPADVDLGPYAFPPTPKVTTWDFDSGAGESWSPLMGVSDFAVKDGKMHFTTATTDPALNGPVVRLDAAEFEAIEIRMRTAGAEPGTRDTLQFFWSGGGNTSEAQSIATPVTHDGAWHTYRLDLANHPRWRGAITRLRLDPSIRMGLAIAIERIAFVGEEG
jgi:hypothetical protein